MTVICAEGWLQDAERVPSPNYGPRPEESDISLLVVHNISLPPGQYGGGYIQQFFQNRLSTDVHPYFAEIKGLQVSSHLLIERSGHLVQFVPFSQRAWHAGVSVFGGRDNCNDFSIGIELEGTDDSPYTAQQYDILAKTAVSLMQYYPGITPERIVGHCDIAPGRKTDPGAAFDWALFRRLLEQV
ncbi:1,6-anhydro-N-acetylmuramyl-L-alanine amidase AmpD [Pontibacter sp. JAM-7]|uniref:1,6-anhydro-N-acetylmuramyl-L-alanine amidase AmpD n=1 Tax=Pontibacter sp. JAM-7 TaxID=3366581 RepID=UPI003AF686D7